MNSRIRIVPVALLSGVLLAAGALGVWGWQAAEPPAPVGPLIELTWDDLIPDDYRQPDDPFATLSQKQIAKLLDGSNESNAKLAKIDDMMSYAPVKPSLDNRRVQLAGYVVALDFDGQTRLKEFLLVPYFGACIHTPPPPSNQVILASSRNPVEIGDPYQPVVLVGTLRTDAATTDLAEAGYVMQVTEVLPYE